MSYTEVKKEYVIETIAKGSQVICCDFSTMRMADCAEMTVNTIMAFINKSETKFFKAVANDQT